MSKTLILIRHASRDKTPRSLDNGLNDKGKEQARSLKRFFIERFSAEELNRGLWLVSSPKVRCFETLSPLAKALEKTVDIHPLLNEQGASENLKSFEARVQSFLTEWKQTSLPLTVLCSHGDWLPVAVFQLLGLRHEFKKGSWLELLAEGQQLALRWYVPSFKVFYSTSR